MRLFPQLQLPFNLETQLGFNTAVPNDHQLRVRNALATFLLNTKLVDCF